MNKEEINVVTISLERYEELVKEASFNRMIIDRFEELLNRFNWFESRLMELENKR